LDIGQRGRRTGKIRLLRQIADGGARLHEACAVVGLDEPGGNLQEGRLSRSVTPDEAHPLAGRYHQFGAFEQRRPAEGERDIPELQQRRHDELYFAPKDLAPKDLAPKDSASKDLASNDGTHTRRPDDVCSTRTSVR